MEALVFLVLFLAAVGGSDGAWCLCRPDVSTTALQKTLDYACGAGADCTPISQNGACYNPNTVLAHCSYAANSYYQRKGQAQGTCDFTATATVSPTDPSSNGCTYPATPSAAAGTSTPTPSTTTPTTAPGTTTTTPITAPGTTTTPPTTFAPPIGTGIGAGTGTGTGTGIGTGTGTSGTGGVLGGLGPSGNSISTDNGAGGLHPRAVMGSLSLTILMSSMVLLRG